MRILIISNLYPPYCLGECELRCRDVAVGLQGQGHAVTVLTSTYGTGPMEGHVDGIRVRRRLELDQPFGDAPAPKRARRKAVFSENVALTLRTIEVERPTVVFLWRQARLTMACVRAAAQAGVPVVVNFSDMHWADYVPRPFGLAPGRLLRYAAGRSMKQAATFADIDFPHAVCVSRSLKKALIDKLVPAREAKIVYPGVDLAKFTPKEEPGLLHSPLRLLYVGELHSNKGVHMLLDAARLIAEARGPESVSVTIVGEGDPLYREQLNEQAKTCPSVRFMGGLSEDRLPEVYREHDVFVFPSSEREDFPLALLQAAASGTTIVTTAHGGQGEFITDDLNGLIFTGDRANRLASRISHLVNEPRESRRLAQDALTRVERNFSLVRYVRLLEMVLERAGQSENAQSPKRPGDIWESAPDENHAAHSARDDLMSQRAEHDGE